MEDRREKRAAIFAFTENGEQLAQRIAHKLQKQGYICTSYPKTMKSLTAWTGEQFAVAQVLIFVGAAGIAVRAVACWVKDKFTDPAVVVVDEMGKFVIPLLSGHLGGANDFARMLAAYLCAVPVITTATDLHGCFAVDVFAREKGLWIADRRLAKEMSAAALEGKAMGFFFDHPLREVWTGKDWDKKDENEKKCAKNSPDKREQSEKGRVKKLWIGEEELPGFCLEQPGEINLYLGIWKKEKWQEKIPKDNTLQLVPKVLTLGVGCRRGIASEDLKQQVMEGLDEWGIWPCAVKRMATITLKKEEKALDELCQEMHWELCFFSPQELLTAEGEFSYSAFVEEITGVGNVCERAAVLGAGAPLLKKKIIKKGVTLAASW